MILEPEMEACCPLCKVTYYVTWELGDGVREQPVCPVDAHWEPHGICPKNGISQPKNKCWMKCVPL